MLISVLSLFSPLNGVLPYSISYRNTPRVHQSTALPWPCPEITSGAKYSCVPTKDFDLALIGSAINSVSRLRRRCETGQDRANWRGAGWCEACFSSIIVAAIV
ncbi:hypothetical protein LINPERPRIM_LOCUS687 [Linum perenne]